MMALIGAFTFEFEVSLPLLAETTFHGGAASYSWLIGALGAGAVAGGLYAARSARTGVARLTRAALGYAIAVGLVAAAPTFPAAVAACGSGRRGHCHLPHHGKRHHPASIRARLPRSDSVGVDPGPTRAGGGCVPARPARTARGSRARQTAR